MTDKMIVEYNPIEANLAELRDRYAGVVFAVQTKEGMEDAKKVKRNLVKLRTGLEDTRKTLKEPALRRSQAIDAEAKAIEKAIREIENPISEQIESEEKRLADIKRAEEARIAEIKSKIEGIRALPLALAGSSYAEILAEMEALEDFAPSDGVFGEQTADCRAAIQEALVSLDGLATRIKAQEALAEQVEAERKRIAEEARIEAEKVAKEREAMEAERKAFEAEKAAFEAQKSQANPVAEPVIEAPAIAIQPMPSADEIVTLMEQPVAEKSSTEPAPSVSDWRIRRFALATAEQFSALAMKVGLCGVAEFASELNSVAISVRDGSFDALIANADQEAILKAESSLLDATTNAIDSIETKKEAA